MRFLAALVVTCVCAFSQRVQRPLPEGVYRVGNGVTQPSVISKADPEYSEESRLARMSGTVKISAVVGVDGRASDVQVVRSAGLGLDEKAAEAVRKWVFKPGVRDGMPVPGGMAENLHIEKSSDPALESEVIRIVRGWPFRPGMRDGQPVSVPCTMEFVEDDVR
jgi:TonB family protein